MHHPRTPFPSLVPAGALALALLAPAHAAGADGPASAPAAAAAAAPVPGDAAAGKALFARRCASCHQVGPSARGGFGPQLNGLLGRPAGSTPDFRYSEALKNAGIVWTEATLRAFLKSPGATVPGNKMRFLGLGDERRIDDLLAYLRSVP